MRIVSLVMSAALVAPGTALPAASGAQTGEQANASRGILERTPSEWAQAPADTWKDWDADVVPPETVQPFLLRAVTAYRRGDLPLALEALYELLDEAPDYPSALHQAGVIYFRLRRYGDAVVAFERYLAIAPQRLGDTRALAHCYYTLGDYTEARAHYVKVLAVHPDSVEAHRGLALAAMRLGEAEVALEELALVLRLDPEHANAATWVAQILFDEERVEEALEAAQHARDLDPFEPRPWFLLSQIHFDLGQDELGEVAEERFGELNQLAQEIRAAEAQLLYNPRQPAVYRNLIRLQRRAGDLLGVGEVLNRWLKAEPNRMDVLIAMLDLAEEMHNESLALKLASRLGEVGVDSLEAWERLVRFYAARRDRVHQIQAEGELARLRNR